MRKGRKEELFSGCFRLLLLQSIDGLSIPDIERELGITRGSIFYYAETKLDLFHQILEHYIVEKQTFDRKVDYQEGDTLRKFIDRYVDGIERTMQALLAEAAGLTRAEALNGYMELLLQVKKHFPDLHQRYREQLAREESVWRKMVKQAIECGEVRPDVPQGVLAKTFATMLMGRATLGAMTEGMDLRLLKKQLLAVYDGVKLAA